MIPSLIPPSPYEKSVTELDAIPGRMVKRFAYEGGADTDGRVWGPYAVLEHVFVADRAPRYWLRFISADGDVPYEGALTDFPLAPCGPFADRGEAEDVAAFLNRQCDGLVFFYATTRSPLEVP